MNILISRHDKIGDFITTLPLFYVIKKNYPNSKIFALVSEVNEDLAKKASYIDRVVLYDKYSTYKMIKVIRSLNIDISISAYIDSRIGLILTLGGIKTRIAPATKVAQLFFNKTLKQNRSKVEKTEVGYNIELAKVLNKNSNLSYKLPLINIDMTTEFSDKFILKDKKNVIIHPGYGGSSDGNINLKEYLRISNFIRKLDNTKVSWVFGPDDLQVMNKVKPFVSKEDILYCPKSLIDYCKLISRSVLLISTSTGPMHLAGALNVDTVSFFGDSLFAGPKRWATVSDVYKQHNFIVDDNLNMSDVENSIKKILC